ncbi:MAG TPA: hypothetical protein VFJ43_00270, partial [Bacteroidia bacterium]|nr:hypothetical protein [Bacteroidia bacterium]
YTPEQLVIDGPGVSRINNPGGIYQFNPGDAAVPVGKVSFVLSAIDKNNNKTELANCSVLVNQASAADFGFTITFPPNNNVVGTVIAVPFDKTADLYEWNGGDNFLVETTVYTSVYYKYYPYYLTLRTRKFFGSDCICTSETTQLIGESYNFKEAEFNPIKTYSSNNRELLKLADDKTFTVEVAKYDSGLVNEMKNINTTMKEALSNPTDTTKLISGNLDQTIKDSGMILKRIDTASAGISDAKVQISVQQTTKAIALNSLIALSLRNPSVAADAPLTDSVNQISESLNAIAVKNKASFTANDKQMLDHAFELAVAQPELQKKIDEIRLSIK